MKASTPGAPAPISKRRAIFVLVFFAILGIGLHLLAPTLNGIKLAGLPFGYWIAAQLGHVALALLVILTTARKEAP